MHTAVLGRSINPRVPLSSVFTKNRSEHAQNDYHLRRILAVSRSMKPLAWSGYYASIIDATQNGVFHAPMRPFRATGAFIAGCRITAKSITNRRSTPITGLL